jgi:hypothetical protein
MTKEERSNILDQHKSLYDGYVTRYNQESNQYPLYVQDLANDKNGITVTNKGNVKTYTNMNINESMHDRIGDGPMDLKNGTVNLDSEYMEDIYPSPNEEEFDYKSFGNYEKDMEENYNQYEYDIDELEDYSSEEINETFNEEEDEFNEFTEEDDILDKIDEDVLPDFISKLNESLDMFERFKKYN